LPGKRPSWDIDNYQARHCFLQVKQRLAATSQQGLLSFGPSRLD
jgi:hypothetical protein